MMRRRQLVRGLGVWLLLALAALAAGGGPAAARPQAGPLLRLHRGSFDARAQAGLTQSAALDAVAPGAAIIQFAGPVGAAQRAALQAAGVRVLEYIPDGAFLVQGDGAQLAAAAALPGVYARAELRAADKLAPDLLGALRAGALDRPAAISVWAWPGRAADLADQLAAAGIDPAQPLGPEQILAAAGLPAARLVEPAFRPRLLNDSARAIIGAATAWADHGLYGAGQIVAVADSGLDTGVAETISADFAGRIVATHILSDGGTLADEFGHGTHVAGSLAGSGADSGAAPGQQQFAGSFAGVAPAASLVIQAFEVDAAGQILGLSDDPYPIFAQAYADGARIHSDSWGGPSGSFLDPHYFGGYPTQSRRTDEFVWQHPDMAIFVASGNNGNDGTYVSFLGICLGDGDGWIDEDSLLAPATAKNVITVGAAESLRLDGNLKSLTWSNLDPTCYAKEPLTSDLLSNNANGMAAFSARGPVDDGRIKPDLVAPGTSIVSNRSHAPGANALWGVYTPNPDYVISGGTSMATPIAAGAGALVREWLVRQGLASPSAAALKAVLLNTAADSSPGQYVVGARQEIPSARPNIVAGWGRVDLRFLSAAAPQQLWLDDHTAGLATGDAVQYHSAAGRPLVVTAGAEPLRVMLAWSDPPASPSAAVQLVNDLDLVLRGPDGREYYGNGASAGDRLNNVEGLVIASPPPGAYSIEVRARNVPVGAQPFALVVSGPLRESERITVVANRGLSLAEGAAAPFAEADLQAVSSAAAPEGVIYTITQPAAHGDLRLSGVALGAQGTFSQADIAAGRLSYAHGGGESSADGLTLSVDDGAGPPIAGLRVTITVRPVNDPPVAQPDTAATSAGVALRIDVLANDSDAEGGPLSLAVPPTASHGALALDGNTVIYTPTDSYVGVDSFTYTLSDPGGATAQAEVRVTLRPAAPAPPLQLYLPLLRR